MTTCKMKEIYSLEAKYGAFFSGGNVIWDTTINQLLCQDQSKVNILNIDDGKIVQSFTEQIHVNSMALDDGVIHEDEDQITSFQVSNNFQYLVTAHKSRLIKLWSRLNNHILKTWQSVHKGPIVKMSIKDNQLATGGTDGSVRLWDIKFQSCTNNLKGCQGVISVLKFHNDSIFAAGDNTKIHGWDRSSGELLYLLEDGHFSKITDIHFVGQYLISSGRDKVIIKWDLVTKQKRILPTFESLETLCILSGDETDNIHVLAAGQTGVLKIWDLKKKKVLCEFKDNILMKRCQNEDGDDCKITFNISEILYNEQLNQIAVVTYDHNIILYNYDKQTFIRYKQFTGYTDEILDIVLFGQNQNLIAVASNSADIKLYDSSNMSCKIISGHEDIVLSLAVSNNDSNLLVSSSKDNSVRLWYLIQNENDYNLKLIGVGKKHTASVGSVVFTNNDTTFLSASQDTCFKLWQIPKSYEKIFKSKNSKKETIENDPITLDCLNTISGHDKDVNCICCAPNGKYLATGSQDKLAKIWTYPDLNLYGTLRGHKRGVWCVRFSTVDQVVLTTSADCTVKLWSVTDLNCLKTFENSHEASILRAEFLSNGQQIITAGADGLIKLWLIKTSECSFTFPDEHSARIWALAVNQNESVIYTGGGDSFLIKWKDVTEEKKTEELEKHQQMVLDEQKLSNYIQNNQLLKALKLALKLNRPANAFKIFQKLLNKPGEGTHDGAQMRELINGLSDDQKQLLLNMCTNWNTNSKYCYVAQMVLEHLINVCSPQVAGVVESVLPYTERHFVRLTKLQQDLYFLDFLINAIQLK